MRRKNPATSGGKGIVEQIKEMIVAGVEDLPPGSSVTEKYVQTKFKVGRSAARSAIKELSDQGVLFSQHDGYFIPDSRTQELADIYAIRVPQEVFVGWRLAKKPDYERSRLLRVANEMVLKVEELGNKSELNPVEMVELMEGDVGFHVELFKACSFGHLVPVLAQSIRRIFLGISSHTLPKRRHEIAAEHRRIYNEVLKGNTREVTKAIVDHLVSGAYRWYPDLRYHLVQEHGNFYRDVHEAFDEITKKEEQRKREEQERSEPPQSIKASRKA